MNNSAPLVNLCLCPIPTTVASLKVKLMLTNQLENMFFRTQRIDLSPINFDYNSTPEFFFRFEP